MSYYKFKLAVDTIETGRIFPQVQKMTAGYDFDASNSVYAISRETEKLPEYEPNLNHFSLHGRAKLTDILSVSVIHGGFLISEKFKTLLEKFTLPTHKFYPAKVQTKKQFLDYYWLHIICNLSDYVDYPKSTFFVYYNFSKNLGYVDVLSKNELIIKEEKLKSDNPGKTVAIWAEKIYLNSSLNTRFDLFKIGTINSDYFISESLRQSIHEAKITGCDISEANNLIVQ
ncbi:imm11 family protein [Pseudobacter ginsenosidimutans]|uniref:Immunity MXAN-0049 protein domain-containing protein n=1 Tax=Pseudobacter ginsenosidimutans TaxID=661488 RepID=A0A4Q7N508_9BACT|nr:DUF1629 domain-containing protein [Pseudobacter ginsenosidimutans]QEC44621.1 hypothetical protein FSB84_24160 [Pseudobacter ginsenosidimutans]RZS76099.1 hypothetical protein EV199_1977 [Pseudobacter ginsenosidimutans]